MNLNSVKTLLRESLTLVSVKTLLRESYTNFSSEGFRTLQIQILIPPPLSDLDGVDMDRGGVHMHAVC